MTRGAGIAGKVALSNTAYVLAKSAVAASNTAVTTEEALATITIPANAMGPNGFLRIFTAWTFTNSANTKTFRVRLGGISGTVFWQAAISTQNVFRDIFLIANRNATNSQVGSHIVAAETAGGLGQLGGGNLYQTGTIDTSASTTLVITGQKGSSGETLTLEMYFVELFYGS
jgi:hypothetical protein